MASKEVIDLSSDVEIENSGEIPAATSLSESASKYRQMIGDSAVSAPPNGEDLSDTRRRAGQANMVISDNGSSSATKAPVASTLNPSVNNANISTAPNITDAIITTPQTQLVASPAMPAISKETATTTGPKRKRNDDPVSSTKRTRPDSSPASNPTESATNDLAPAAPITLLWSIPKYVGPDTNLDYRVALNEPPPPPPSTAKQPHSASSTGFTSPALSSDDSWTSDKEYVPTPPPKARRRVPTPIVSRSTPSTNTSTNTAWTTNQLIRFSQVLQDSLPLHSLAAELKKTPIELLDTFDFLVRTPIFKYADKRLHDGVVKSVTEDRQRYGACMARIMKEVEEDEVKRGIVLEDILGGEGAKGEDGAGKAAGKSAEKNAGGKVVAKELAKR